MQNPAYSLPSGYGRSGTEIRSRIHIFDFSTGVYSTSTIESIQIRNRQPIHNLHLPPKLVQRNLRVLRPQLACLGVRHKHKVISKQGMAFRHVILLRNLRISLADVNGQRILDSEDRVRCFVWITAEV